MTKPEFPEKNDLREALNDLRLAEERLILAGSYNPMTDEYERYVFRAREAVLNAARFLGVEVEVSRASMAEE